MLNQNSRIPVALQAVFLESNRGHEVNTPPPGNIAIRVFKSFFQANNEPRKRGFFGLRRPILSRKQKDDTSINHSMHSNSRRLFSKMEPQRQVLLRSSKVPHVSKAPFHDIYIQYESPMTSRRTMTTSSSSKTSPPGKLRNTYKQTRKNSIHQESCFEEDNSSASSITYMGNKEVRISSINPAMSKVRTKINRNDTNFRLI
jgi:nucleoside diphosphate kinase